MLVLAVLLLTSAGVRAQTAVNFGSKSVGTASGEQSVTVKAQAAGNVASVKVLTLGAPNLDFAVGAGTSTCENATLAVGATCTESVTFTPRYPGLRIGAVVLQDSNGNVLGTTYLSGIGSGGLGVLVSGNTTPIAGDGDYKNAVGDGRLATLAELFLPSSLTLDGAGNMYIADTLHNRIRKVAAPIAPATIGVITTIADSNGTVGYQGDNGPAANALLDQPAGVALDGAGNLYIADTANNVVRMIAYATGVITTVAGNSNGTAGYGGDGLSATSPTTQLNGPTGIAIDASGNLYIADTQNSVIRRVDAVTGIITTVAGNGTGGYGGDGLSATSTKLNLPSAVAFDLQGDMYIADSLNNRVRKVDASTSIITTFAGNGATSYAGDGGAATQAALDAPSGVVVDPAGNVYIADTQNSRIRKVNPTTGIISSLIADKVGKYLSSTGSLVALNLYGPIGLYLDGLGNLYFADSLNMVIRKMQGNFVALDFTGTPVRLGDQSAAQSQTVENDGNAPLNITAITHDKNDTLNSGTTTCTTGSSVLAVNASCVIGAVLAPSTTTVFPSGVTSQSMTADIDVGALGDTVNSPLDIELIGKASAVKSTTIAVTSSITPSGFGQSVTFTATVQAGASTGNLTGTVSFFDGTNTLAANVSLKAPATTATATFTTSTLTVGLHSITASYKGDNTHFSSTSTDNGATPYTQTVQEATKTVLVSSTNGSSAAVGQNITFTATVTASNGGGVVPDGTVIFSDGATILNSVALNAGAVASTSTTALAAGMHSIIAAYGGDSNTQVLGSTSNPVSQDVLAPSNIAVASSGSPSIYGTPVTFTATVTPSSTVAATGTVNFLDAGKVIGTGTLVGATNQATFTISSLSVASHAITVTYLGDTNNSRSSSVAITQVVNQAQTSTTVASNLGIAGKAVAITATVKVIAGAATTTGTVTFKDGTTTLGTATLNAAGTATISPILATGDHSIIATYAGDGNDTGSSSAPLALTVQIATTSTTITSAPNPAIVLATVTFTAKVTGNGGIPTGSVSFLADNISIGTANLNATGTATLTYSALAAGSHPIAASYAGDANDATSSGAGTPEVVGTIPTVTDLASSSTTGTSPQLILVAVVVGSSGPTPTGTVTFSNGSTVVGAATLDSSGVATLTPDLASGTYNIVATYGGDTLHTASTSKAVSISTVATGFSFTVTPASLTMATSQNASVTVAFTSTNGFADTIGLGCASLPAGVTCHFASISADLKANATQSVKLTIDTNSPLMGGSSAMNMNSRTGTHGAYLAGLLLPFSAFFGWVFWRFRKRNAAVLATVAMVFLFSAALLATGCSGITSKSASPGTYVIQVTGTGANSGITHYQNVTLTITK